MNTNQKIEWEFQVDRAYMPLSYSFNAFINSRKYIRRYVDISDEGTTGQVFYPNDVFWSKGIKEETASKQAEHHKKEGNIYLWNMAKVCEERGENLINNLKAKLSADYVKNLSNKEIESLFTGVIEEIKDFSIFITIPWCMESYLNGLITEIVRGVVAESEIQNTIAELLLPLKINDSSKEGPIIWSMAIEISKDEVLSKIFKSQNDIETQISKERPEFLSKIDSFVNDYGWIHVRWFKGTPITRMSVINRLKTTLEENPEEKIKELEGNERRVREFAENFSTSHSLTPEQRDTIFLIKEYVYIRTYRTDTLSKAFYLLYPLLLRATELLGLTLDETLYYSETELRKKLRGEMVDVNVDGRREVWGILVIGDEYKIYSGKEEVERLKKDQGVSRGVENVSEVKGISAFKGVIKGRVKIVLDPNDISKVERGDVLVAVMTFPSYITAMEKAVAFVTDEGGILCHASIIAREMKKPCVISTKIGTKVFKDGDLVEVDANTGIVKKIS